MGLENDCDISFAKFEYPCPLDFNKNVLIMISLIHP